MKKIIKGIDDHFEEVILIIMMCYFIFATMFQVIARFALKIPAAWTEESARYVLIWMCFIGYGYASKMSGNIRIDVLEQAIGGKIGETLKKTSNIIFLIFNLVMLKVGFDICYEIVLRPQKSAVMGIPMLYVYAALPAGMLLSTLRIFQNIVGRKIKKEGVV